MSDDNDSGGIIGTIISVLILAAIWPYLLALLGIYIANMVVLAMLTWIAENWILTISFIAGILAIYCIFKYKLISKAWKYVFAKAQPNAIEVRLNDLPGSTERKFIPSTNLYCYWCTKKLGIKAWEKDSKYYCQSCQEKLQKPNVPSHSR
ncbi:hypothetical protein [Polynucleobacter sphagniphilus]|jgi:hypothetical protein|uniref:Uncharacterized protein n=1 Tax=Polynucleobacter sphagniphilus TaxID=1743169 RepID=A0AA43S5Z0_9BURK|nr:hypothetical protein [Polynucleobacter sphagniphilus]MDH6504820.1 hypothetical protein [Polynucleobacter sphagniphilus]MDH6512910.1 hypothetical protein [Polynucleobacter sphagniphilus]